MTEKAPVTATIAVDDYYDPIHRAAWMRRTSGFMAGATVAGGFAAAIGAVAAFIPYVLSALGVAAAGAALPTLAAVAGSAALFAGIGALTGLAAVAVMGGTTGGLAQGFAEKEAREKARAQGIGSGQDVVVKAQVKDPAPEKTPPLFNPKVPIFTVPLFALFGAVLAVNPETASTVAMGGFKAATAAGVTASAATFGLVGFLPSFKFSYLTNACSNFYMKVITGKLYDELAGKKPPQVAQAARPPVPAQAAEQTPAPIVEESRAASRSHASGTVKFSLEALLDKTQEQSSVELRTHR